MKLKLLLLLTALMLLSWNCHTNNDLAPKQDTRKELLTGIDVSHHQGKIDWKLVKGVDFVYIKATEGATYVDPMLKRNSKGAAEAGIPIGYYHFFRMTSSPEEQYNNFISSIRNLQCDLIPMVDVETGDGKTRDEVQKNLSIFLELLEKEYGTKPMIYGTMRSYNTFCSPEFNDYPLYIGRYGSKKPEINGGGQYLFWQYSENGCIAGCDKPVDLCKRNPKSDCSILLP